MQAFDFFKNMMDGLLKSGALTTDSTILVVAGGAFDRSVLLASGFANVTISNLDTRMQPDSFAPYAWALQDAENLTFPDGAFDVVIVHAGLHHCRVPHQALAEMYRVARHGILVIESRDNALMRLGVRLGFVSDYEVEAVVGNGMNAGGQRNTGTPNYVYRWTEREFDKALRSIDPTGPIDLRYSYAMRLPLSRLSMHRNGLVATIAKMLAGILQLAFKVVPKQGNLFGLYAAKPTTRWPWLQQNGEPVLSLEWAQANYREIAGSQQR